MGLCKYNQVVSYKQRINQIYEFMENVESASGI